MKQELLKPIVKVGNSAGVILPKEWLNGKARIELIEKPLDLKKDIFEILEPYLNEVVGVYIVGSYARNEQTPDSDVDVLVITNALNKKIKKGRYELICIPKKELEKQLDKNILPILPMIKESKTIINKDLIRNYINAPLTEKNLKWHIDTTKSAMKVIKKDIDISKELNEKKTSDRLAYSLILRLRTLYIIDCIRKNKIYSKKNFLQLIKKLTGSLEVYYSYLRIKSNKKTLKRLKVSDGEKIIKYVDKNLKVLEKWLKEKKD